MQSSSGCLTIHGSQNSRPRIVPLPMTVGPEVRQPGVVDLQEDVMETLVTVIFIGVGTAALTAMHLHLTARPAEPLTVRSTDEIDAEFFRIIRREWRQEHHPNA
jgi:hypothetical protein